MGQFRDMDVVIYQGKRRRITDMRGTGEAEEYRIVFNHGTHSTWKWVKPSELTKAPTKIERLQAEIAALKAKLESIRAAHDEAQSVLSVLNPDPTVAMFQIATHFQAMGNKVGRILQERELAVTNVDAPKTVDCPWCGGKGMRYSADAGFQCKPCKGTGKTDAGA